ncbi:MAG TPA: hypothetical protein VGP72_09045 [Planctomycetota bacterium]|jgi:NhaP-type Na+/H+ or K+/H+ antiporter
MSYCRGDEPGFWNEVFGNPTAPEKERIHFAEHKPHVRDLGVFARVALVLASVLVVALTTCWLVQFERKHADKSIQIKEINSETASETADNSPLDSRL